MIKPIIIVCGQDKTGKTTLVNQLANHFGPGSVKHHSSSPPKDLSYPFNKIWEDNNYFSLMNAFNMIASTNAVIVDRFHLGMYVYGKRYRNYPESLHVTDIEWNMPFFSNTFLILLADNAESIFSRDDGMSFEKDSFDFYETAVEFKTEFDLSSIPNKLRLNISQNGGFSETLLTVINFVESRLCKE